MFTNIEGVIFDLDGTLVDSMWLWEAIDVDYLARFNLTLPSDLKDDIEGMSFTETAHYFKKRFNLGDAIEDIKKDWTEMAYGYYENKVPLKKGILKLLESLKEEGIPMGIGTSNSRDLVNIVLDKHHIKHYFSSIRTSCEVQIGKPAPDIFLKVAEDLGIDPSKCLVFEDVINGIIAGQKAGMKVCAIYDEHTHDLTEDKKKLADYYIEDYEQLFITKEGIHNEV
ncbi:HAD superfamily hydrolase (TIGR01509 family)/HAD superfamily hydrolase (TIGR01549 family) [Natranaerovirga pectinivora]|uniref:HAD superfamily hydrolase (TIGR01509 family)/HAD superfamily hydrolase (TIGR01549 family) n=1 Tax=Natranaerovirga pectinivora TaxID=682400 RepID=A0A4R3MTH1_9FIRM|nr:HAD family phosphatase [Natranaerovirga pectinivora]TCT17010.1 HAD superfamily hydrolase (TIGR01509 family)/HAD superfamily hydrolase (TIGR01549 family) [Natranaerovirga pectinivora]